MEEWINTRRQILESKDIPQVPEKLLIRLWTSFDAKRKVWNTLYETISSEYKNSIGNMGKFYDIEMIDAIHYKVFLKEN